MRHVRLACALVLLAGCSTPPDAPPVPPAEGLLSVTVEALGME